MIKFFRKLKSKFMHWHKLIVVKKYPEIFTIECKCGLSLREQYNEKSAKETAWKGNVNFGNAKANYINNGVLKTEQQLGIKLS
jgi:hypothetical protein